MACPAPDARRQKRISQRRIAMTVSIITPTYNRAYILPQCYLSLCAQTNNNFEWIVVDDGSTDNTEQLIQEYIAQGRIAIRYFRQKNGGKHRAHNTGVTHACGDLCVCLDSDDMLSPDAVERACQIWNNRSQKDCIGILALRGNLTDHAPICSHIPAGIETSTMTDLYDVHGFKGDTVLFFETGLLKRCKFREFEGEKFLSEDNLYCELDTFGPMILVDEVLYYCEYRPDGLTAKFFKLLHDNPKGAADSAMRRSYYATSLTAAFKYAVISRAYNNLLPPADRLQYKKHRFMMFMAGFVAPVYSKKIINKYGK